MSILSKHLSITFKQVWIYWLLMSLWQSVWNRVLLSYLWFKFLEHPKRHTCQCPLKIVFIGILVLIFYLVRDMVILTHYLGQATCKAPHLFPTFSIVFTCMYSYSASILFNKTFRKSYPTWDDGAIMIVFRFEPFCRTFILLAHLFFLLLWLCLLYYALITHSHCIHLLHFKKNLKYRKRINR